MMLFRRVANRLRLRAERKRLIGRELERLIDNRLTQRQRWPGGAAKLGCPRNCIADQLSARHLPVCKSNAQRFVSHHPTRRKDQVLRLRQTYPSRQEVQSS